jgi:hypothetical protein
VQSSRESVELSPECRQKRGRKYPWEGCKFAHQKNSSSINHLGPKSPTKKELHGREKISKRRRIVCSVNAIPIESRLSGKGQSGASIWPPFRPPRKHDLVPRCVHREKSVCLSFTVPSQERMLCTGYEPKPEFAEKPKNRKNSLDYVTGSQGAEGCLEVVEEPGGGNEQHSGIWSDFVQERHWYNICREQWSCQRGGTQSVSWGKFFNFCLELYSPENRFSLSFRRSEPERFLPSRERRL